MNTDQILYAAMAAADERFQAAVVKQFGKRNAGTMRYMGSRHNAETAAASKAYHEAAAAWMDERERMRSVA